MIFNKNIGIVSISDPSEVETEVNARGVQYHKGAIFVTCSELGFEGGNLLYCRYALPVKYVKVEEGDRVWIEPTIVDGRAAERWVYTGFADCGDDSISPSSKTKLIIPIEDGEFEITFGEDISISGDSSSPVATITVGDASIVIDGSTPEIKIGSDSADESYVLGDSFKTELDKHKQLIETLQSVVDSWTPVANDGGAKLKADLISWLSLPIPDYTNILSNKIKGE